MRWALDGYLKVFWRNAAVWELWPQVLVLSVLGATFLGIARLLSRRWDSREGMARPARRLRHGDHPFGGRVPNLDVLTETYATLAEAQAAGAVDRGWLPRGLPPGTRELRLAHDLDSTRRWGLFNFPPEEGDALRALTGPEIPLDGLACNPPGRIEWWPVLLRQQLNGERIKATGLRGYAAKEGDLVLAVNWAQGRAYYWSRE